MNRHTLIAAVAAALLFGACAREPAASRPREGAPVAGAVQVAAKDALAAAPPPTLAPIAALATAATPPRPSPAASPTMVPTHVIVATGGMPVNLRAWPSTAAPVITTLREGTLVEALGEPISVEGRAWQEIRIHDREGWVVAVVVRRR